MSGELAPPPEAAEIPELRACAWGLELRWREGRRVTWEPVSSLRTWCVGPEGERNSCDEKRAAEVLERFQVHVRKAPHPFPKASLLPAGLRLRRLRQKQLWEESQVI